MDSQLIKKKIEINFPNQTKCIQSKDKMDSQMNNTDLYCGACCINLLHDDDIVSCECCTCERVPNEIMFEREIIKKKIEINFPNQTKCIQSKDKMDSQTMIDYSGYSKKAALMKMFDAALGEGWSIPPAEGWTPPAKPTKPVPVPQPIISSEDDEKDICKLCNHYDCECEYEEEEEDICEGCGVSFSDECKEDCSYQMKRRKEEEKECAEEEEEEDDAEEEEDDEDEGWAACYGAKTLKTREYIMAGGGSHWWNYVVDFDENGEQVFVYIENKDGKHQQFRQKLAYRIKDGVEQMRLVGKDWEPDVLQEEGLVFYCE